MREHLRSDWANKENEKSGDRGCEILLGSFFFGDVTADGWSSFYFGWKVQFLCLLSDRGKESKVGRQHVN